MEPCLLSRVGINNQAPKATLDVTGKDTYTTPPGIIAPRLTGNEIQAKDGVYGTDQKGALLYATSAVTAPSGTKTTNITSADYYYFDGAKWIRLGSNGNQFFYMPSIAIPTSPAHFISGDGFTEASGVFSVNLYNRYVTQFGTPAVRNSTQTTMLPVFSANKLDFYITYFDPAVFETVAVSNAGVLSFRIKAGAQVTSGTFMNIVFAVKP